MGKKWVIKKLVGLMCSLREWLQPLPLQMVRMKRLGIGSIKSPPKLNPQKKTWFKNHHLKLDWIIFDMTLTENILARLLFQ